MKTFSVNYISLCFIAIWLFLVGTGWVVMTDYQTRPGDAGRVDSLPAAWRANGDTRQLFAFLHPRCPCSQATVSELNRVLSQVLSRGVKVKATAFFFCPSDADPSWIETSLWESAKRIPELQCTVDFDAGIAREFGVVTSGHVLVYEGTGPPSFSGGITPGRGHQGACDGAQCLKDAVQGELLVASEAPVYGCRLYEEL